MPLAGEQAGLQLWHTGTPTPLGGHRMANLARLLPCMKLPAGLVQVLKPNSPHSGTVSQRTLFLMRIPASSQHQQCPGQCVPCLSSDTPSPQQSPSMQLEPCRPLSICSSPGGAPPSPLSLVPAGSSVAAAPSAPFSISSFRSSRLSPSFTGASSSPSMGKLPHGSTVRKKGTKRGGSCQAQQKRDCTSPEPALGGDTPPQGLPQPGDGRLRLCSPVELEGGRGGEGGAAGTHPRPTRAERGTTGEAIAGLYLIGPHSEAAPRPGRRVGPAPASGVWGEPLLSG